MVDLIVRYRGTRFIDTANVARDIFFYGQSLDPSFGVQCMTVSVCDYVCVDGMDTLVDYIHFILFDIY